MWLIDQHQAPAALPPGKRPSIHFTGGLVGAGAVLFKLRISRLALKCLISGWSKRISAV